MGERHWKGFAQSSLKHFEFRPFCCSGISIFDVQLRPPCTVGVRSFWISYKENVVLLTALGGDDRAAVEKHLLLPVLRRLRILVRQLGAAMPLHSVVVVAAVLAEEDGVARRHAEA